MSQDNEDKTRLIENQWFDIVPPAAPDDQLLLWWSLSTVLLVIVSSSVYLIWRRQPQQRLKRNIYSLLNRSSTEIDPKNKLRQLEKLLCQYYHTTQLSNIELENTHWNTFRQQLQKACYQSQTVDEQHAAKLIQQANSIFLVSNS